MKITNNTTNIKQHKCLQKISEIVDKTQLKKKQFKYVININHEPDDKIKKDIEKSLDKKDVLIKTNAIAIICESIWRRRNKRIHEEITLKKLREEKPKHLLKKTQEAALERTKNNIYKLIRQSKKATTIEAAKKFKSIISSQLERFRKN
ncbi:hypothetical protein ACTFIT_010416 [Dictyostelium discoideum]